MLTAILRFSLRFRGVVYALSLMLAAYGFYALAGAKLDVFPEFAPPTAVVQAEAPGLTAEQVEALVTQPIEQALAGMTGLQALHSKSLQGLSMVTLVFNDSAKVFRVRQLVSERLGSLGSGLPAGVQTPKLLPLTTAANTVLMIGLTSSKHTLLDVHDIAEWTLKRQLQAVPGVADVIVFGGETRQLQVQPDPEKLVRLGLTLQDVAAAVRSATGVRGAGFIENANQRIGLAAEGQNTTPLALSKTVLAWRQGAALTLGDVARVAYGAAPAVGAASVMGKRGVIMLVESQYGANTLAVTEGVERALADMKPALNKQGYSLQTDIFRPANFIEAATRHLGWALLAGGALVMLVLFLFLLNARTAAISALAIPLSLLAAVIVLQAFGISLNTMTLGGLAIALGELVDDAIIDIENIYRRLRENSMRPQPLASYRVVLRASLEVRSAVVYATFVVILIFLPVFSLTGVAGRLFAPLGFAYVLAVLASLGVALTLTPALALAWLPKGALPQAEPRWLQRCKARYLALLGKVEQRPRAVIAAVAVLCTGAVAALPFLHGSFIPALREGHYIAHVGFAPGTALTETMRAGDQISRALAAVPGVRVVAQTAGRAGEVVDPAGVHLSEFDIDLAPAAAARQDAALQQIRAVLASFPGVTASVNTFLVERIDESITGVAAPIVVNVIGDDLDVIDREAAKIARLLGTVPGAAAVRLEAPPNIPVLSIRLKQDRLNALGFKATDVLDAIQLAYQGAAVAQIVEGSRSYDLTVSLPTDSRRQVHKVADLMLRSPSGQFIALGQIAEIVQALGRYQIARGGGQRMQTVSVNLGGRAPADFVSEAQARVDREIILPKGTYAVFAGEGAARRQAQFDLAAFGAMAFIGIALLLFLALKSRRGVALVMLNLPFSIIGGIASIALAGADLSLGAMVGFVTLFGISLRNAIMLISHYEHLVHVESLPWNARTAMRGAGERLVPILMTAVVTALALAPLAVTSGAPGNEIEGPMAIVILGGLVTSTLLNLIVMPALALRYGRFGLDGSTLPLR